MSHTWDEMKIVDHTRCSVLAVQVQVIASKSRCRLPRKWAEGVRFLTGDLERVLYVLRPVGGLCRSHASGLY